MTSTCGVKKLSTAETLHAKNMLQQAVDNRPQDEVDPMCDPVHMYKLTLQVNAIQAHPHGYNHSQSAKYPSTYQKMYRDSAQQELKKLMEIGVGEYVRKVDLSDDTYLYRGIWIWTEKYAEGQDPAGDPEMMKARFCFNGKDQVKRNYIGDTWAPSLQRSTLKLSLIHI